MRIELNQDSHAVVTLSFFCDDTAAAGRMYANLGEQIDHGRLSITTIDAQPAPMASPVPETNTSDESYPYDLGFLDITCENCGAGDCPLSEGARPGEWLCDPCKDAVRGGDAISRLMRSEQIGFVEAVERVAKSRGP